MRRYWLWVWIRHTLKNGWSFDTKEEAESFYARHFRDEPAKYEITFEE